MAERQEIPVCLKILPCRYGIAVVEIAAGRERPAASLRRHVDVQCAGQVHLQLGDGERLRVHLADDDRADPSRSEGLSRGAAVDGKQLELVHRLVPHWCPEEQCRKRWRVIEIHGRILEAVDRAEREVENAPTARTRDSILDFVEHIARRHGKCTLDKSRRLNGKGNGARNGLAGVQEGDRE